MAELVDALDLGSSGVTCRGSSPLSRTTVISRAGIWGETGPNLECALKSRKSLLGFHGHGSSRLNVDTDKPGAHNLK